jgi:O-antigen/teichoic acid export membrane protein
LSFKSILRTFRESKYVLLYQISERFFFFLIFWAFARFFPVEIYGKLISTFTIANICSVIFDLGLQIFIQREFSINRKNDLSFILSSVLSISVAVFPLFLFLVLISARIISTDIQMYIVILIGLFTYLYNIIILFNRVFWGQNEFKKSFYLNFIFRFTAVVLIFLQIVAFQLDLFYSLIILNSVFIIFLVYLLVIFSKQFKISFKNIKIRDISLLLKTSIPLGLAVMFNFLYDKIDVILISKLLDFNEVAYYGIGYGLYKSSSLAFSFLFIPLLSKVSYLHSKKNAVSLIIKKYMPVIIIISFFVIIIILFAAPFIVNLIYTFKYENSVIILKMLSFSVLGLALNNFTGTVLNGLGYYRENMLVTLFALILNIVMNIILIKIYGIMGAVITTIITEYFILFGDSYYIFKYFKR